MSSSSSSSSKSPPIYCLHEIELILTLHYLVYQDIFKACRTCKLFRPLLQRPLTWLTSSVTIRKVSNFERYFTSFPTPHVLFLHLRSLELWHVKAQQLALFKHMQNLAYLHMEVEGIFHDTSNIPLLTSVFSHLSKTLRSLSIKDTTNDSLDALSKRPVFQRTFIDLLPLLNKLEHLKVDWALGSILLVSDCAPLFQLPLLSLCSSQWQSEQAGAALSKCNLIDVVLSHPTLIDTDYLPAKRLNLDVLLTTRLVRHISKLSISWWYRYHEVLFPDITCYENLQELKLQFRSINNSNQQRESFLRSLHQFVTNYQYQCSSPTPTHAESKEKDGGAAPASHSSSSSSSSAAAASSAAASSGNSTQHAPILVNLRHIELEYIHEVDKYYHASIFRFLTIPPALSSVTLYYNDMVLLTEPMPFKFATLSMRPDLKTYKAVPSLDHILALIPTYFSHLLSLLIHTDGRAIKALSTTTDHLFTIVDTCRNITRLHLDVDNDFSALNHLYYVLKPAQRKSIRLTYGDAKHYHLLQKPKVK